MTSNLDALQSVNVTRIINCTQELPNHFEGQVKYLRVAVPDEPKGEIEKHFEETAAFIHELASAGERGGVPEATFVHCSKGISRSCSIILSYLIQHRGMTLIEAFAHTQERRPMISPNSGFMEQLSRLEQRVTGKTTIDPSKYERYKDLHEFALPGNSVDCEQQLASADGFDEGQGNGEAGSGSGG